MGYLCFFINVQQKQRFVPHNLGKGLIIINEWPEFQVNFLPGWENI